MGRAVRRMRRVFSLSSMTVGGSYTLWMDSTLRSHALAAVLLLACGLARAGNHDSPAPPAGGNPDSPPPPTGPGPFAVPLPNGGPEMGGPNRIGGQPRDFWGGPE